MLDNIPHIKAYWIMMTPKIAQIAQRFGADDIDGTVVEEKIYHDAGAIEQKWASLNPSSGSVSSW
jgi:aminodeoxyfutalosine synthase